MEKRTIEKAVNGNQKAERLLYDALCKPLFMLCLRYLKHQEDAEDVLSSALIKVFGNNGVLDEFPFMYKIEYAIIPKLKISRTIFTRPFSGEFREAHLVGLSYMIF